MGTHSPGSVRLWRTTSVRANRCRRRGDRNGRRARNGRTRDGNRRRRSRNGRSRDGNRGTHDGNRRRRGGHGRSCDGNGGTRDRNRRKCSGCGSIERRRLDRVPGHSVSRRCVLVRERGQRRHLRHSYRRKPGLLGSVLLSLAGKFSRYLQGRQQAGWNLRRALRRRACLLGTAELLFASPNRGLRASRDQRGGRLRAPFRLQRHVLGQPRPPVLRAVELRVRQPDRRSVLRLRARYRRTRGRVLGAPGRSGDRIGHAGPLHPGRHGTFFRVRPSDERQRQLLGCVLAAGVIRLEHVWPAAATLRPVPQPPPGGVFPGGGFRGGGGVLCWGSISYGQTPPPPGVFPPSPRGGFPPPQPPPPPGGGRGGGGGGGGGGGASFPKSRAGPLAPPPPA